MVVNEAEALKLAMIQCTDEEIGTVLGFSAQTFRRYKRAHKEFCTALEKAREGGRQSIRRLQYKAAAAGNVTMLIWLGKQYLGQRDRQEVMGKDGGPIEHSVSARGKLSDLLTAAARRGATAGGAGEADGGGGGGAAV